MQEPMVSTSKKDLTSKLTGRLDVHKDVALSL